MKKDEGKFVSAFAQAIAVANGHSHPEDWAAAVVGAYASIVDPKAELDPPKTEPDPPTLTQEG